RTARDPDPIVRAEALALLATLALLQIYAADAAPAIDLAPFMNGLRDPNVVVRTLAVASATGITGGRIVMTSKSGSADTTHRPMQTVPWRELTRALSDPSETVRLLSVGAVAALLYIDRDIDRDIDRGAGRNGNSRQMRASTVAPAIGALGQ